ncbi:hypothetical protein [Sorangium sp. So ce1099]|uniref:hypothetical protein n=1 Tax=Sorangium sp. So ce1099 TaxID=3133331 RepID=UPI003F5F37C2
MSSAKGGPASIERVRVDRGIPGGFIIVTEEPAGTFDVWVETEAEVVEFLEPLGIRWEQ